MRRGPSSPIDLSRRTLTSGPCWASKVDGATAPHQLQCWMQASDGQAYVTVVSLVNETNLLDEDKVVELMVMLRDETATLGAE